MRTASIGYSSANIKPVANRVKKSMTKNSLPYEKQIKASDVLPASALLGATLAAIYMVSGGNYNRFAHDVSMKNIVKISDKVLSGFRNSEALANKEIKALKSGFTKVLYSGEKNGKTINHAMLFDLGGDLKSQLRSYTTLDTVANIPVGYNKKTQFIRGLDKYESFVETNYSLDMKPKSTKIIKKGNVKEIIYGYDINGKHSGIAYTDGNKVALKFKNDPNIKKFNTFEEIFNSELADDFRQI